MFSLFSFHRVESKWKASGKQVESKWEASGKQVEVKWEATLPFLRFQGLVISGLGLWGLGGRGVEKIAVGATSFDEEFARLAVTRLAQNSLNPIIIA